MSAHMSAYMGSVNISLRREAYEFLRSLKRNSESFSDIVLGFRKRNSNSNRDRILGLFNQKRDLSAIDWKEKERRMKSFRDSFNKRLAETRRYMKKSGQK